MEEGYKLEVDHLLQRAFVAYDNLSEEYKFYSQVQSSKKALDEIQRLLGLSKSYFHFRELVLQNPKLNVGLLSAKALDPFSLFKKYATTLHRIWYFISPIHVPSFGSKQALAYYFYRQHGYNHKRISSHFCGIDFYKPVYIKIIPKFIKMEVYQWKLMLDEQGDYYAESKLAVPNCLGISLFKKNSSENNEQKKPSPFQLGGQVAVLVSSAVAALDYWSLGWDEPIQTKGGCIQYFNHNERESNFKELPNKP